MGHARAVVNIHYIKNTFDSRSDRTVAASANKVQGIWHHLITYKVLRHTERHTGNQRQKERKRKGGIQKSSVQTRGFIISSSQCNF